MAQGDGVLHTTLSCRVCGGGVEPILRCRNYAPHLFPAIALKFSEVQRVLCVNSDHHRFLEPRNRLLELEAEQAEMSVCGKRSNREWLYHFNIFIPPRTVLRLDLHVPSPLVFILGGGRGTRGGRGNGYYESHVD